MPLCDPRAITCGTHRPRTGSDGHSRPEPSQPNGPRLRRSELETCGGQGRGRTTDLPHFRLTAIRTEQVTFTAVRLDGTADRLLLTLNDLWS
jgi:hypothetical protein